MANVAINNGWDGDQFQLMFFSMGQGDCCVVTCPDGQQIMIDCGSKNLENWDAMVQVQELLRGNWILGHPDANRNLTALILTHPDIDHINKVDEILSGNTNYPEYDNAGQPTGRNRGPYRAITVDQVYFSDYSRARGDFSASPLLKYNTSGCSTAIYNNLNVQKLNCVTINANTKGVESWTPPFGTPNYSATVLTDDELVIADGSTTADKPWKVSIIAGNVDKENADASDGDGRNAASLVTLLYLDTDQGEDYMMICGDATVSTENYLIGTHKFDTNKLDLIHAPHHGSAVTSSTEAFVDNVQPSSVIISVKSDEHSHHLPGKATISNYSDYVDTNDTPHVTGYWEISQGTTAEDTKKNWDNTGVAYVTGYDSQGRPARYIRTGGVDANFSGARILDGFNGFGKYIFNQKPTSRAIRQTGLDGHSWYYFP